MNQIVGSVYQGTPYFCALKRNMLTVGKEVVLYAFGHRKDYHYAFKRGLMEDVWEIRVFLWFPARKGNQTWKKERIREKQSGQKTVHNVMVN